MFRPSHSPEMTSPVTSEDFRDPCNTDSIVSQWQHLASMDWGSPDFLSLLSSLTANSNRCPTIVLVDADARAVLNIMDEVSSTYSMKEVTTYVVPLLRSSGVVGLKASLSKPPSKRCGSLPLTQDKFPIVIKLIDSP